MPLAEVFQKIYEKCEGKQTIDPKSPAEALKNILPKCCPNTIAAGFMFPT